MNILRQHPDRCAVHSVGVGIVSRWGLALVLAVTEVLVLAAGSDPGYLIVAGPVNLRFQSKKPTLASPLPMAAEEAEAGLMQGPPVPVELFLRGTEKPKEEKAETPVTLKPLPAPPIAPPPSPQVDPFGSIQPLTQDPDVVSGRILVKYFNSGATTNGTAVLALPFGFTPPQPTQAPSSRAVYTTTPSP